VFPLVEELLKLIKKHKSYSRKYSSTFLWTTVYDTDWLIFFNSLEYDRQTNGRTDGR